MADIGSVTTSTAVEGGRRSPGMFLLLTFGWSWTWWAVVALTGVPVGRSPAYLLFLVGGLGPSFAALTMVFRHYSPAERVEFWRRMWDPRRIGGRWWLVVVAAGAGPTFVGWMVTAGGDFSVGIRSNGAAGVGVVAWLFLAGGAAFVEEPGWRGYGLDALLSRFSMTSTSLVLGVAWMGWHLPHFFIEGTYQHGLGFGSGLSGVFAAAIIAQTFLYVWVVTNTGMSILAAVVLHASTNLAGELFDPGLSGRLVALALWTAAAIALIFYWRRHPGPLPTVTRGGGVGEQVEG